MTSVTVFEISTGVPHPYGPSEQKDGINFAIYAKDAKKVSICFYEESSRQPFQEIELDATSQKTGEVWHALVKGLPPSILYLYRVTPIEDESKNYLLLDPLTQMIKSDPVWHENLNENRTKYSPLGKAISNHTFDWEEVNRPNIPKKDLIIYEMHVRGFTRHDSSNVENRGTFKAIIDKIPHLLELGINAVELMPVHEFNEQDNSQTNPKTQQQLHNYFGYSTVNFFSPMNRFASSSECDQTLIEFKTMVKELHRNGIEVILDVVFNHSFEGNERGPISSFKGFDNLSYYMMNNEGQYLNFSGCGNTLNCNHPIVREFIVDALRYWIVEMHVDGFRFDLASILTRDSNGAPLENPPIIEALTHDPVLSQMKLIAEAWDAGGLYQVGKIAPNSKNWSDWNGKYRDAVRRFIKGTPALKSDFASAICGSYELYGNRSPCNSINFITAHDGFTLADLVSYNDKHNESNGEENRDGANDNNSWNCGAEGPTEDNNIVVLRKRQMRNLHLALMISNGVPMLLMGDEYGHTREGNNNAWCQDNELNWFLWQRLEENKDFYRFYHLMNKFRREQSLLGRDDFYGENEIKWHGINPDQPEWDTDNRFVAFTLNSPTGEFGMYVAFNASSEAYDISIPNPSENKSWYWIVNTNNPSPDDFITEDQPKKLENQSFKIAPYSSILLICKS